MHIPEEVRKSVKPAPEKIVNAMANAISYHMETACQEAACLNNPGCVAGWHDDFGNAYPTIQFDGRSLVHFPDLASGKRALRVQCRINVVKRRLTPREFFAGRRGVYRGFGRDWISNPETFAKKVLFQVAEELGFDFDLDQPMVN